MHGTTQHGVIVAQPGIFEAQSFPGDNALGLASSQLGGEGSDAASRVRCLVEGVLLHLACLALSGNPIGNDGITALAKAASDDEVLPRLVELHIRDTQVTHASSLA